MKMKYVKCIMLFMGLLAFVGQDNCAVVRRTGGVVRRTVGVVPRTVAAVPVVGRPFRRGWWGSGAYWRPYYGAAEYGYGYGYARSRYYDCGCYSYGYPYYSCNCNSCGC